MMNEKETLRHMLSKRKETILRQKENIFNAKKNLKKMKDWINKEKRENFLKQIKDENLTLKTL